MGLPPATHDPETVRELADDILARARYARPPESIPERVQRWFGEQVGRLLSELVGTGAGTLLAWIVVLACLAAIVYLVARHGRRTRPAVLQATRPDVMVELTRSPDEWRREATALEEAGRWREGLRCRHRGLVGELVRRGAVREQAGRTAGEHLRDVAATWPEAATAMAAATELFEAAWYGDAATGAAEAARFRDLERQVLDAHPAAARAVP